MFELIERKERYAGPIFSVFTEAFSLPGGLVSHRDVVKKHCNASAVLIVKDGGNVVFVRQYRPAVGADMLELPAGTIDEGETALECAVRELEEETGLKAGKMEFMLKFHTSVGFCDEEINIYLASELSPGKQNFDDDEMLVLEEHPLDEAIEMIFDGRIADAKTVAGLLAYKHKEGAARQRGNNLGH